MDADVIHTGFSYCIIDIERRKNQELDAEREEVGCHRHEGHDDSREIDFSEDIRVRNEGVGCGTYTTGEIAPDGDSEQVEQDRRYAIRSYIRDTVEYRDIDDDGEDRRDKEPERSENRLLIRNAEGTFDEEEEHVAVAPYLLPIDSQQFILRRDR